MEFDRITNEISDLKAERSRASESIQAVLDSVTTVARLTAIWPEVAPIVEAELPKKDQGAMLPALPIKELNKQLGL